MITRFLTVTLLLVAVVAGANWAMDFDEEWAQATAKINPIAWYKLDGNALDSSGNGYDGTWTSGESYAAGPLGQQSALFDGTDAIIIPHAETLNIATGGTITAWAYVGDAGPDFPRIVSKSDNVSPAIGGWEILARRSTLEMHQGMQWFSQISPGLAFAQWQHHAWTFDGVRWKFWLNGEAVYDVERTALPPSVTTNLAIGNNPALSRGIVGRVADVRIYNLVLSEANIAAIMSGKSATEEQQ